MSIAHLSKSIKMFRQLFDHQTVRQMLGEFPDQNCQYPRIKINRGQGYLLG